MSNRIQQVFSSLIVQALARFILGAIFILAGINKISHPGEFTEIIFNYKLIADFLINPVAIIFPWIEVITGIFLIAGIYIRTSTLILSTLLLVFILALALNLLRGINVNCGCFSTRGIYQEGDMLLTLGRDILFLVPGIVILFFSKAEKVRI